MGNKAWLLVKSSQGLYWVKESNVLLGGSSECDYQITHLDDQLRLQFSLNENGATLQRLGSRYPVQVDQQIISEVSKLPKEFNLTIQISETQFEQLECVYLLETPLLNATTDKSKNELNDQETLLISHVQRLDEITQNVNSLYALSAGDVLWNLDNHIHTRNGVNLEIQDSEFWASGEEGLLEVNGKPIHMSQVFVGDRLKLGEETFQVVGQSSLRRALPPTSLNQQQIIIQKENTHQFDVLQYAQDYEEALDQHELELFRSRLQSWLVWNPSKNALEEEENIFNDRSDLASFQEAEAFDYESSHHLTQSQNTELRPRRKLLKSQNANGQAALDQFYLEESEMQESIRKEVLRSHMNTQQEGLPFLHKVAIGSVLFLAGTLLSILLLGI